jgi:hypothetical protein
VIERLHEEGIGGLLAVERHSQIGPDDERQLIGWMSLVKDLEQKCHTQNG